jgi:hypothetical protein
MIAFLTSSGQHPKLPIINVNVNSHNRRVDSQKYCNNRGFSGLKEAIGSKAEAPTNKNSSKHGHDTVRTSGMQQRSNQGGTKIDNQYKREKDNKRGSPERVRFNERAEKTNWHQAGHKVQGPSQINSK